jgi:L-threonylcarbamoyladenylate synthase
MKITTDIHAAVQALKNGNLVAFATETVYGLGADARNPTAIKKVFVAKGRPIDHPLIIHVGSIQQISDWACDIPDSAWQLAKEFWPGGLTLILKKRADVADLITAGQESVAIRIPNHPLTLNLLQEFGSGLVGPSANKYGHVSPTTAAHVLQDLKDSEGLILDGGPCNVGIESTIINLLEAEPVIMRQGAISITAISKVLRHPIAIATAQVTLKTSGSHASHYAPHTPAFVLPLNAILQQVATYLQQNQPCSVLSFSKKPANISSNISWQTVPHEPQQYVRELYANLRQHDQLQSSAILIEAVPQTVEWAAIANRLTRASFKK